MIAYFENYNPIYLALFGGMFTLLFTSLGAGIVFFFKKVDTYIMNSLLAISAGIMLAASFFSLINPAITLSSQLGQNFIISVASGFIIGGLFIYLGNKKFDTINVNEHLNLRRCILLFISITLHNIPEGLAVGVAFGNMMYGGSLISALSITFGIAIQNFPEGSAISLPLRREGISRTKSFLFGFLSGVVEPISAVIGAILIIKVNILLPFILSFAAGAMIFVTVLELIPESQSSEKKDLMALLLILGFSLMMVLDVLLG